MIEDILSSRHISYTYKIKNQLHSVPRTEQGRHREPSVRTLRSPLSAEFWRHCLSSGGTQRRDLSHIYKIMEMFKEITADKFYLFFPSSLCVVYIMYTCRLIKKDKKIYFYIILIPVLLLNVRYKYLFPGFPTRGHSS